MILRTASPLNGSRFSGERSAAARARRNCGLGARALVNGDTRPRYAWAGMLFNEPKLGCTEPVEPEGPGAPAARSPPAPARMTLKHFMGAGQTPAGRLPGPHTFPRAPNELSAGLATCRNRKVILHFEKLPSH